MRRVRGLRVQLGGLTGAPQRIELEDGGWAGRFVHPLLGMRGCWGPWFLILKVHVSLLLKEEPPNIGVWFLKAAWGELWPVMRGFIHLPCADTSTDEVTGKILTPHRLASFQIPGLRLQMGHPHSLFSCRLALLYFHTRIAPSPLLLPTLHPSFCG